MAHSEQTPSCDDDMQDENADTDAKNCDITEQNGCLEENKHGDCGKHEDDTHGAKQNDCGDENKDGGSHEGKNNCKKKLEKSESATASSDGGMNVDEDSDEDFHDAADDESLIRVDGMFMRARLKRGASSQLTDQSDDRRASAPKAKSGRKKRSGNFDLEAAAAASNSSPAAPASPDTSSSSSSDGSMSGRRARLSAALDTSNTDTTSTSSSSSMISSGSDGDDEGDNVDTFSWDGYPKSNYNTILSLRRRCRGYDRASVPPYRFIRENCSSLHNAEKLVLHSKLEHHQGCVNSLHFNATGNLVASGSDDLNVAVWDWANSKLKLSYDSGHRGNVFQAKFMPQSNDSHVVSCARDGRVRLAQISGLNVSKNVQTIAHHRSSAHKLALNHSQGHTLMSCGEDAVVFDIDLRKEKPNKLLVCKDGARKIALYTIHAHPRNDYQFAVGGRDVYCRIYDKRKMDAELKKFCPQHLQRDSAVASGSGSGGGPPASANITCLVYNYDGSEILTSYNDEDIYLFDSNHSDGADFIKRYTGHRNNATVKGVNFFGANSEFIVSGSDCHHIFVWEKQTQRIVRFARGDEGGVVNVLEPHPHYPYLATSGLDHEVKIWMPGSARPETELWISPQQRLAGLQKLTARNSRERLRERHVTEFESVDSQLLWTFMRHLHRRAAHRRREDQNNGDASTSSSSSLSDDSEQDGDSDDSTVPTACRPS